MEIFFKIFIVYNSVILGLIIILVINFFINLKSFKRISDFQLNIIYKQTLPKISVLVPARNESKKIENCLISLLEQDYNKLEIIVLDDNSTDDTYEKIKALIDDYNAYKSSIPVNDDDKEKTIRLLSGLPLKDGWVGKNYACYQLEKAATGDYILFTDADTVHSPDSISSGFQCLISNNLDALSAFPEMQMDTFAEKMVIGFIKFGILLFLPLYSTKKTRHRLFNTALGSYMFYRRKAYRAAGGHAAIFDKCLEDINMSILLKNKGFKFSVFDGYRTYSTRMYSSFTDIAKGFSRFILTTFNYKKFAPSLLILSLSIILLLPFLVVLVLFIFYNLTSVAFGGEIILESLFNTGLILTLLQVSLLLLIKTIYVSRFEGSIIDILLHPVSIGIILILGLSFTFGGKKTLTIDWKGRKYGLGKTAI